MVEAERELIERNEAAVKKTKEKMQKYFEDTKESRGIEKKVREEVGEFHQKADVQDVFNKYNKNLHHLFKFYAAQDKKSIGPELDVMYDTINYREWVKFGYQTDIIPNIVSPEEHTYIYRFLMRERFDKGETLQVLDYEGFKKALIHVAAQGYEYFGGLDEEKYQKKKEEKD